jgi:hypothetical protein
MFTFVVWGYDVFMNFLLHMNVDLFNKGLCCVCEFVYCIIDVICSYAQLLHLN